MGSGGESGGGIRLRANELIINGNVSANGGDALMGGAGGGGRIKLYYANLSYNGFVEARGGSGLDDGEDGTINHDFPFLFIWSNTHPVSHGTYINRNPVIFWDTPGDIEEFYYTINENVAIEPDPENGTYTISTNVSLSNLSDGYWKFSVNWQNSSGDVGLIYKIYSFYIDNGVVEVSSSSHPNQSEFYFDNHIELRWNITDRESGFYYVFDNISDTVPDNISGTYTNDTNISFSVDDDGTYYFHIVPVDTTGYIGTNVSHYRVNIDTSEWDQTYGGPNDDVAFSSDNTSDGGVILAGRTKSFGNGLTDFWIVKVDENGNHQWNKTYGGQDEDRPYSIQQTSDGGYIVAGSTYSFGVGDSDFWLIKLDGNGNHIWNKTYGGTDFDWARSVKQTSDGGYVVAGHTISYGNGFSDIWLIKIGSDGNHEWNKTFGSENYDKAYSVEIDLDGGYIISGHINCSEDYLDGLESTDAWLIKTDSNGNHEWNKTYNTGRSESIWQVLPLEDGYIFSGRSYLDTDSDFYIVRTNNSGVEIWSKSFGGEGYAHAQPIIQTDNSGFLIGGMIAPLDPIIYDGLLIKLNKFGNLLWNKTFGKPATTEMIHSMVKGQDGSYFASGRNPSRDGMGYEFWLIKFKDELPVDNDQDGFYDYEDCDDYNASIYPGATEVYNLVDDDCDYLIDEGICIPDIVNTSWSDWWNVSCLEGDVMNQSRNRTQYDSNNCGVIANETFFEYRLDGYCDYCIEDMQYTLWTAWVNITCLEGDVMNQSRNRTYYDANYCGDVANTTEVEYRATEYCEYCIEDMQYTPWTAWINITCLDSDLMNQSRNRTYYDANYCGDIANTTLVEYRATEFCGWLSRVEINLIDPLMDINVTKDQFFDFTTEVCCYDNDCSNVDVYLDPKQEVEYTPSTKTVCSDGICTKTLYSGVRFVNEDNEWKEVEKARSLKGVWKVVKGEDPDYPVDVIDLNYSSIKLKLGGNKDSYLRVYNKNNKSEKLVEKKGKRIDKVKGIGVMGIDDGMELIDLSGSGEIILGQEIKYGSNSTIIRFEENFSAVEDAFVDLRLPNHNTGASFFLQADYYSPLGSNYSQFSYLKFDISSLKYDTIIDADLFLLYLLWYDPLVPDLAQLDLFSITNQSWLEGNNTFSACTLPESCKGGITYNTRPLGEYLFEVGPIINISNLTHPFLYTFDVTSLVDLNKMYGNVSFVLKTNKSTIGIYSKEHPSVGGRPVLNISYVPHKGNVETTIGATPFYTIDSNPITLNLAKDECQDITWRVNATGDVNTSHIFFVYSDFNGSYVESDRVVLSIIDKNVEKLINMINISYGWNLISFLDENDSIAIPLDIGWNLFGYSTEGPLLWETVNLTDGIDIKNVNEAGLSGWIQPLIYYYGDRSYSFVPNDDSYLRKNKGYWIYSMRDDLVLMLGNLTTDFAVHHSYYWPNVTINNGTEDKNLSEAESLDWLQSTIYYYDNGYKFVPGDSDVVYPWKGYWVYANKNLTLIVE